jgi:hypothetical protein
MHPTISDAYSRARVAELRGAAHRHGSRSSRRRLSFRSAEARDRAALDRLAVLDAAEPLACPLLVAEIDDEVVAAIGAAGEVIADPFVPTSRLVETLRSLRGEAPRGLGARIRSALA